MRDVLYCTACRVYWWTANQREDSCPECGLERFFLLRAGDFGTAIYFDRSGDDPDRYRLVGERPVPAPAPHPIDATEQQTGKLRARIEAKLREEADRG